MIWVIGWLIMGVWTLRVDRNSTLLMDEFGRYRVYHGVNVVYKTPPYYPELVQYSSNFSLTHDDLTNLESWGFNMIRLYVAWEGVETYPSLYNFTYVQKLREIVRMCNDHNIMVLLDAHQDLLSRRYCGEGFPLWAAPHVSFPKPIEVEMQWKDGVPAIQDCLKVQFGLFYATYDVMRLQEDFFTNQRGLLDHFAHMWEQLAVYMKNQPNILGYELINQPIGANVYKNPLNFLPGVANNKLLFPAYQKLYSTIRKHDKKNLIFFEPDVADISLRGFYESLGESSEQKEKQVLSYHVYCRDVDKQGEPQSRKLCSLTDRLAIDLQEEGIKRLGVGGFLTEFGALSDSDKSAQEVTVIADLLNGYFRSWCYWQFKYYNDITTAARPGTTESFYDERGQLQENKVKALARPYAYAICGQPIKEEVGKGTYKLKWRASRKCYNKKTEIFTSPRFYFPYGARTSFSHNCEGCKLVGLARGEGYYQIEIGGKVEGKEVWMSLQAIDAP